MSFKPTVTVAVVDPVIQTSGNTTFDPAGQVIEVDSTAAAVDLTLPNATAVDGAEFAVKWQAGANSVSVLSGDAVNYPITLEDGSTGASFSLSVLEEVATLYFTRLTASTGRYNRK